MENKTLIFKDWLHKMIELYRDKLDKNDHNYDYSWGQLTAFIICEQRFEDSERYKLPCEESKAK